MFGEWEALEIRGGRIRKPVDVSGQDCLKGMATEVRKPTELATSSTSYNQYLFKGWSIRLGHDQTSLVELPSEYTFCFKPKAGSPKTNPVPQGVRSPDHSRQDV